MRAPALTALVLLAALTFFGACGGDGDNEATTAEDVAPELVAALGVPATLHSPPVTETFGPDGGTLELADGATLEVPEGAFAEDTELTIAVFDLDYGEEVEAARAYYVGTEEEVGDLPEPVVLTASGFGTDTVVVEHIDGEGWQAVGRATGPDVRIEMAHFSFKKWLIATCQLLGGFEPVGFMICVESLAPGACVGDGVREDVIESIRDANFEACDEQFGDGFILDMMVQTRKELEAAGVAQAEITSQLDRLEGCLELGQFRGLSDGVALEQCGEHLSVPDPSPPAAAETATATAAVTAPPQPTDPPPTAAATAPPVTDAPAASLSFMVSPVGVITSEDSQPCVLWPQGKCRAYEITFRMAWAGLTGPASVYCGDPGRDEQTQPATPPSGDALFQLVYGSWQWDYHPFIRCQLRDADGKVLDFISAQVQV